MKATGIVRSVDHLGRICIPIELRRLMSITETDPMEIFIHDDQIILRKYQPGCIFCGNMTIKQYKGKLICRDCSMEVSAS